MTLHLPSFLLLRLPRFSGFLTWQGLCLLPEIVKRIGRITGIQHALENGVYVTSSPSLAQSGFLVYPDVDDHFVRTRETEEQSESLVELGAEPVPVVLTQGISLTEVRRGWIGWNNFQDETIDCV